MAMQSISGVVETPALQIDEKLNELYERRLAEIDTEAEGDAILKEITYKEWIKMLREINLTLIKNIHAMDLETSERLELLQRKVSSNCRFSHGSEVCKCRKDIQGLMQLVRNGRLNNDWNTDKFKFETITKHDIFGNNVPCCDSAFYETPFPACAKQPNLPDPRSCSGQQSKLTANVKALAIEVAGKHDEIRDLKKQILSMEDEIQKAQKKIQLKDDVIRELRSDLKSLPKCTSIVGTKTSDRTTPTPCCSSVSEPYVMESPTTPRASYSTRDSINSLNCEQLEGIVGTDFSVDEDEEETSIKCLKEEINELFEMRKSYDQNIEEQKRSIKEQQKRLNDKVEKLEKTKNDFQKIIRLYRHNLINLDNPQFERTLCSDVDSGLGADSGSDVRVLNSVHVRFSTLNEEIQRLKRDEQCMKIKYEDVKSKAIAKTQLLDKTSTIVQEVADVLSNAICNPIAYDTIFESSPDTNKNPIVDAVNCLIQNLKQKENTIAELKTQIANTSNSNQEITGNTQSLCPELNELKRTV